MGLSASQARFLQLTAKRSNIEYQAQQINFERLQLATQMEQASAKYQDATSDTHMVFSYNNGVEVSKVDVSYSNYINIINQQDTSATSTQERLYLVTTSGKLVVQSREDMEKMIESTTKRTMSQEDYEKELAKNEDEDAENDVDLSNLTPITLTADDGSTYVQWEERILSEDDFWIADDEQVDLSNVDLFQSSIQEGIYSFARLKFETDEYGNQTRNFNTESWDTICAGVFSEDYNKANDAEAEAEYKAVNSKLQRIDKTLELELENLESEREAIQTEIESVSKVIQDNIEGSFNTFS